METWSREPDGMDLLKDITSELRGGDERTNDDHSGPADGASGDTRPVKRSTTATDDSPSDGESGDETDASASAGPDEHLCSFCETEFDASRDVCPECDAEIVLRGAR
ncbi:hypothetical protein M0R89_18475 (plasmid) [Halorussus limi]|uniref:Uncharacterized protein n=1 Tax=Halorussus limi TaxID=2938695 RepID=A0A8U0I044_9EURY|nr:hypothetical protein [Halorussus limi]UPV76519.1 hypothetical protein M0R89_18475 [Halorussus limi]